ncbi:MAG: hypothetical protein CMJ81_08605 [Planctomycetaceae bacterium]|nr:hypothetical protein [Planctomycetaceae bacterium]
MREQGMGRKEASDEAWRQALAEFPPLASDPGSEPGSVEAVDAAGIVFVPLENGELMGFRQENVRPLKSSQF